MNQWSLKFGEVIFYDDETNFTKKEMVLSYTANEKQPFKIELDDRDGSRTIISCAYLDVQIKANSSGEVLISACLACLKGGRHDRRHLCPLFLRQPARGVHRGPDPRMYRLRREKRYYRGQTLH